MVNEDVNKGLISISNHSKRLISAQFQMGENKLHVISAYAPTEEATDEEKQAFYDALQAVIEQVPSRDTLVIGGDFNAHVGGESPDLWQGHLGKFARPRERCTDNGHRLLTACVSNDLAIRSTFFRHQMRHRVTWTGMDGLGSNQIDHILVKRRDARSMTDCRAFWGTKLESDHNLVVGNFRQLGRVRKLQARQHFTKKLDAGVLIKVEGVRARYEASLEQKLPGHQCCDEIEAEWDFVKGAIQQTSQAILRPKGRECSGWMTAETLMAVNAKQEAWVALRSALIALRSPQGTHKGTMEERKRPTAGVHERKMGKSCRDKTSPKEPWPGENIEAVVAPHEKK